ncbi:FecR family protein [Sphingobacterium corticibacter]|uniref:Uncharacterized protein n=1 Tax=Sphingobacterium corticibacter TaxID=2171749 RepID=A0A2T8HFU3_9SPHI|nr:FecR domain-containing protein [Sphingobacterium corticibacter]PVH24319.1 hypothetical protein DC487_14640 [Sphingobacterium corticibacter]
MNLERFKRILKNYLDGKLSEEEEQHVDGWFDSISNDNIAPFRDTHHKEQIKADLLARMPYGTPLIKPTPLIRRPVFISIAASIVLICTISFLFLDRNSLSITALTSHLTNNFEEVSTPAGEMQEYILPDHSSIWLSGNSKIRFDKKSYSAERKIYLDQGEAFFDVQRDTLHPFAIETGNLSIQVLGTSFNVKHSTQRKRVTIDVKTGKVLVKDRQSQEQQLLTKGKSLRYDAQNGFQLFNSDPTNADLWTRNGIFLHNTTFGELQEVMHSRYGLTLRSDSLNTETFRYSILMPQVRSVDDLLTMICTIHQINYRRKNDEIILYR